MPEDIVFLGVQFSPVSAVYTYAARRLWVKDFRIGDYVVVPTKDNDVRVVRFVQVQKSPPEGIPIKWIIQRVNPALIERALSLDPYRVH
jgi:hypothetical protein